MINWPWRKAPDNKDKKRKPNTRRVNAARHSSKTPTKAANKVVAKPNSKTPATATSSRRQEPAAFVQWRYWLMCAGLIGVFALLIGRAAFIQVIEPDRLVYEGDLRSLRVKTMPSARGMITDRNGEPLAVSVPVQAIWADPYTVHKEHGLDDLTPWYALADVLGMDRKQLIDRVQSHPKRRFIYLQRQVSPAMAAYVKKLDIPGVSLKDESRRFYPTGEVSAHLVGVTGIDGKGLEGVELSFNQALTGEAGKLTVRKDRHGRVVENIATEDRELAQEVHLSIDQRIQALAYRALKQAVADTRATAGSLVMIDVLTGEVIALVNAPSYNPNNRNDRQSFRMRNRAITDAMEPGSTVKPFVVLAALENGVATKDTMIDTGNGIMQIGGSRVRDVSRVGYASLTKILQKSSNIGVSKLSLAMPVQALLGMYSSVGLSDHPGTGLKSEQAGFFPYRTRWSDFERATLSFGYGLSVTAMQLAKAYATLGAYGESHDISILKLKGDVQGTQIASRQHAKEVLAMLETVTQEGGSARAAAVDGYRVGAKTGTSRKARSGGYSDQYVALTAGVAPISHPRLALVVVIDEPQGDRYYGGQVAAPVFSEVMGSALQLLNVAPDAATSGQMNIVKQ